MLVYGDHRDVAEPGGFVQALRARIRDRGCDSWSLVEAGRLVQGLLDAQMSARGEDEWTPLSASSAQVLLALTRRDSGRALQALADLERAAPREPLSLTLPEGYAFYAVYPELYAAAARALPADVLAIGIRSIGTSLSAVVAAGRGASLPLFVRPIGDPFRRQLRIGPALSARLDDAATYAIVDEGPGLSGSSFLSVVRELLRRGVRRERIHLCPSHGADPGPRAAEEDRTLWSTLSRHAVPFEHLLPDIPRWCADLTGEPVGPLDDLSGGAWRSRVNRPEVPTNVQQERRKYLLHSRAGTFLLKFAGLGACGDATWRRARLLSEAGFTPRALGLRNGFLVSGWVDAGPADPRPTLEEVARYLAFRSRALPADERAGASAAELFKMATRNVSLALGDDLARSLLRLEGYLGPVAREMARMQSDNRMHRWEWLRTAEGRLLKTDASDHCRSHDLVGCQDAAWDIAAAAIELDLDERALLRRFHELGGRGARPGVVDFLRPCYLAFQLGACALGAESLAAQPAEAARLHALTQRYSAQLAGELRL